MVTTETEIVVARYNEDVSWTTRLNGLTYIYNKGEPLETHYPGTLEIELPNIGREAHTYLYHIVNNYETLTPITVFTQGNPYDHLGPYYDFAKEVNKLDRTTTTYRGFGKRSVCDPRGKPHYVICDLPMDRLYRKLFESETNCPSSYTFTHGAIFAVNRTNVYRRPKLFYDRALALTHSCHNQITSIYWRWWIHFFERVWPIIFLGKDVRL